jgi:CheY-like chemotaxis protein
MTMNLFAASASLAVSETPAAAWLAASDGPSQPAPAPHETAPGEGERLLGKRVFVAEDEALLALELQLAFEDEGAEVIGPALSLMKALETVTNTREIDCAVLDVDLAGEDVYPIAELLLQREVPFVFHTGHGSRSELTQLFPGTVTLMKPTLPETLIGHLLRLSR